MKKHIRSLFSRENRVWTISFLIVSLLLIPIPLSIGMRNNLAMNILFVCGIASLYLALIHNWKKVMHYAYLLGIAFGLFLILFLAVIVFSKISFGVDLPAPSKIQVIAGGLYTIIGLCICIPGMIIGLTGLIIKSFSGN